MSHEPMNNRAPGQLRAKRVAPAKTQPFGGRPETAHPALDTSVRAPAITLVDDDLDVPADLGGRKDRCLVTVLSGPRFAELHRMTQDATLVGRVETADLRLDDPCVSLQHARVRWQAERGLVVEDLKSTNGTYVRGARIREPTLLADGEYVRLGKSTLLRFGLYDALSERSVLELYESSMFDALTGAHNRRHFEAQLEVELSYARRQRIPISLLLFDLDGFKQMNDRKGHRFGDGVLRAVAASVGGILRPEDVFARYGGDEFVVVARNTDTDNARVIAGRIHQALEALVTARGVALTASVGIATRLAGSECSAPLLVALADRAMYRAKAHGKNTTEAIFVP
jgi:two-component system, cell cycle response regulator